MLTNLIIRHKPNVKVCARAGPYGPSCRAAGAVASGRSSEVFGRSRLAAATDSDLGGSTSTLGAARDTDQVPKKKRIRNGEEIFTRRVEGRGARDAQVQARHAQERQGRQRRQGQEPQAGDCDRPVRGAPRRQARPLATRRPSLEDGALAGRQEGCAHAKAPQRVILKPGALEPSAHCGVSRRLATYPFANSRSAASTSSGRSLISMWPAPLSVTTRASGNAAASSRPALAGVMRSRSPSTSVAGTFTLAADASPSR